MDDLYNQHRDNEACAFHADIQLVSRNCVRQGKASEGNEAVVAYGDLSAPRDNEACAFYADIPLIRRNRSRQGAPSERGDGIVTYVESLESRSNAVLDDLYNQHRVAEGEEPIPFPYCCFVGVHNIIFACQGAY